MIVCAHNFENIVEVVYAVEHIFFSRECTIVGTIRCLCITMVIEQILRILRHQVLNKSDNKMCIKYQLTLPLH